MYRAYGPTFAGFPIRTVTSVSGGVSGGRIRFSASVAAAAKIRG